MAIDVYDTRSRLMIPPVEISSISEYLHIRVVLGIVVGLGLTHLLGQIARIIDNPRRIQLYWVHMLWVWFVFVYLISFWWWEYRLSHVTDWTFVLYVFVTLYAMLLFLLSTFVIPGDADRFGHYREYYYSKRGWFFGTLALVFAAGMIDTLIKGGSYFDSFGNEIVFRSVGHIGACMVAIWTRKAWFHASYALAAAAYQLCWIVRKFEVL